MNYIEQIKGFWIAQDVHQLGTSEIALYFYLLEVCNKTGWTGTFNRNNYKVMTDLSIRSYKTLQSIRDKLSNAEVLVFVQKNGEANVSYKLIELGKKYLGKGEGSGEGKGKGLGEGSGKEKINQTKPNQASSVAKPTAEKKNITEYWEQLVKTWFDFYGEHFKKTDQTPAEPIFNAAQGKNLKSIIGHLKKMTKNEWTENYAVHCFRKFLTTAINHDEWMKNNFELTNLLTKFNSITNKKNGTGNTNTGNGAGKSRVEALEQW